MSLKSPRARDVLTVWVVLFLISGQGFRYLLGLPGYGLVAIATVVLVFMAYRPHWRMVRPPLLIGLFVGLAAASFAWSGTRAVTLLGVVVLIVTTLIAIITVRSHGSGHYMVLLYRGLQASLFLGIAFEVAVATIVRRPVHPLVNDITRLAGEHSSDAVVKWSDNNLWEGGPIQGFVGNRNPFGAIALFAAILAFVVLMDRSVKRADAVATLVAAGGVHLLTQSATVTVAALYVAVLIVAAFCIRAAKEPYKRVISYSTLALTAIAGVLTIKYRDLIFDMLDRSSDATHRTDIWLEVAYYAQQRPEGWGYVGFWPIWDEPYSSIVDEVGIVVTHAHNAYLDSWLQLGIIGLVLFLAIMVLLFGATWRVAERASKGDVVFPLAWALLAAALAITGLTESRPLVEGGWYLIVVLYCLGPQLFSLTMVDPELVHSGSRREPMDEVDGELNDGQPPR